MSAPTLSPLVGLTDAHHRDELARRLGRELRGPAVARGRRKALADEAVSTLAVDLDQPLDEIVVKACEADPAVQARTLATSTGHDGNGADRSGDDHRTDGEPITVTLGRRALSHGETLRIELEMGGTRHVLLEVTLAVELTFTALKLDIVGGHISRIHPTEAVVDLVLTAPGAEISRRINVPVRLGHGPARTPDGSRRAAQEPRPSGWRSSGRRSSRPDPSSGKRSTNGPDSFEVRLRRQLGDDPETARRTRVGRFARAVAGCDETILRACPEERLTFSGFGAVVLGTATLAALSMTLGLTIVFDAPFVQMLPVGLLWGAFILALDRWLVSGTGRGWRHYAPRVLIAMFFGFIIAEPIVLVVFDDVIMQRIDNRAASAAADYRGMLERCNPAIVDPWHPPPLVDITCERRFRLTLDEPATLDLRSWTSSQRQQHRELDASISGPEGLNQRLEETQSTLVDEVGGEVRDGLSGQAGDGPTAQKLEDEIVSIQNEIQVKTLALADLGVRASADAYNRNRADTIRSTTEEREDLFARAGLSRRMDTLSELMRESHTIRIARYGLTAFFVVIDTAPAIMRFASAGGAYDRIRTRRISRRLTREEMVQEASAQVERERVDFYARTEQAHIAEDEAADTAWSTWDDEARVSLTTSSAPDHADPGDDHHRKPETDADTAPPNTSPNGHTPTTTAGR